MIPDTECPGVRATQHSPVEDRGDPPAPSTPSSLQALLTDVYDPSTEMLVLQRTDTHQHYLQYRKDGISSREGELRGPCSSGEVGCQRWAPNSMALSTTGREARPQAYSGQWNSTAAHTRMAASAPGDRPREVLPPDSQPQRAGRRSRTASALVGLEQLELLH